MYFEKKSIEIDGVKFLYEINVTLETLFSSIISVSNIDDDDIRTIFYYPSPIKKTKRKYILFGKKVEKTFYKHAFSLHGINIESNKHSKEYIREMIEKEVQKIKRTEEIERGEII